MRLTTEEWIEAKRRITDTAYKRGLLEGLREAQEVANDYEAERLIEARIAELKEKE